MCSLFSKCRGTFLMFKKIFSLSLLLLVSFNSHLVLAKNGAKKSQATSVESVLLNNKIAAGFEHVLPGLSSSQLQRTFDMIANNYCLTHPNTYIAIIWPRAKNHVEGMKDILSKCGTLLYQKSFELLNDGPTLLYQLAHPGFFDAKLKKHIQNYIPEDMPQPYKFHAILFETDKTLTDIIYYKNLIRDYVGISYWSIHIDDYHHEVINMSQLVFDDSMIKKINHAPYIA